MNQGIVLTMPAYNEADGIGLFVRDIYSNFDSNLKIIVCDDNSTDDTLLVLNELQKEFFSLAVIKNSVNSGHGQSFLSALKAGYLSGEETLITCDGDGQFSGIQIRKAYERFVKSDVEVLEGVRSKRTDGKIRSLVSLGTRLVNLTLSGKYPKDGNTPLRIYKRAAMGNLLEYVPDSTIVPNIWFSLVSRMSKFDIIELQVEARPRLGNNSEGTSWQGISKFRKHKKLMVFCGLATRELIKEYKKVSNKCKKH